MSKRGRPSDTEKFYSKNDNHQKHVAINVTLPQDLLTAVERDIAGKNRSKKLANCIRIGYNSLIGEKEEDAV